VSEMSRLELLEKLLEKATPGEWHTVDAPWLPSNCQTYIVAGNGDPHCSKFVCDMEEFGEDEGERDGWADAELIVAMKNALPELIAATRERDDLKLESLLTVANKVCKELPQGCILSLCMENGAAWVDLANCGYHVELPDSADRNLYEQIQDGLDAAIADQEKKA